MQKALAVEYKGQVLISALAPAATGLEAILALSEL